MGANEQGYKAMTDSLREKLANDVIHVNQTPETYRAEVKAIALEASKAVARGSANQPFSTGDNERDRAVTSDFDRGQRKGIMDWSHQQNGHFKALAAAQKTEPRPVSQMTREEILTESRDLHSQFREMLGRFKDLRDPERRTELREEMGPIVKRESELRTEYGARVQRGIGY